MKIDIRDKGECLCHLEPGDAFLDRDGELYVLIRGEDIELCGWEYAGVRLRDGHINRFGRMFGGIKVDVVVHKE